MGAKRWWSKALQREHAGSPLIMVLLIMVLCAGAACWCWL